MAAQPAAEVSVEFADTLVKIIDGDALGILHGENDTIRIRLYGIDCPERGQPFGNNATEILRFLSWAAVDTPPGDATLRADLFEVSDEQYPETASRQDRIPALVHIERTVQSFDKFIESGLIQSSVQLLIEDVTGDRRQIADGNSELLLPIVFSSSHADRRLLTSVSGLRRPE